MRHIMASSAWKFGNDPFPAFRCELVFGHNKRDRKFLPLQEVVPVIEYTVTAWDGQKIAILYKGTDKLAAEVAKSKHDQEQPEGAWRNTADLKVGDPILPEGKFQVIKTKDKGTILIVPGSDSTNRCLFFVGCNGGFRGSVGIVESGTTGQLLKVCSAGNACESSCEAIVLLEVGQSIAFHTSGRRTNEVYQYTWNGKNIEHKHFSAEEWRARNTVSVPTISDAEIL